MGILQYFCSSIGKKKLMGITGLMWCGFVLSHMLGNLLIFVSPDAYNWYGHTLVSNPAIYAAESLLVGTLLVHILLAINLTMENKKARPVGYEGVAKGAKKTSLVQKTLIFSGLLILAFLILHLISFKFGHYYETEVKGVMIRDLYRLMVENFSQPLYVGWYVVCLLVLFGHLKHGFAASLQSLGLFRSNLDQIQGAAMVYALVVTLGFLSQPLSIFLMKGGN